MQCSVIFILVRKVQIIRIIVEVYLCSCVQSRSHCLVKRHGCTSLTLCPIIAIGSHTEYNLIIWDILCSPVCCFLNPSLRADRACLASCIVLIISHKEEIIIIFSKFLHVIILIEWCNSLRYIESICMENTCKILHKCDEKGVIIDVQFLQVEVDTSKTVTLTSCNQLIDHPHSLRTIAHNASDSLWTEG